MRRKETHLQRLPLKSSSTWQLNIANIQLWDQTREVHQENDSRPLVLQCPVLHWELNHTFEVSSLAPY